MRYQPEHIGYFTEFRLESRTKMGAIVLANAIGSSPWHYAAKAFGLIQLALRAGR